MTDLPLHDAMADHPILDAGLSDMRGRASPEAEEADNSRKFAGAGIVAVMLAAAGVVSYSMGMWNIAPVKPLAPYVEANNVAPTVIVPAVVAAPIQESSVATPIVTVKPPVTAPVPVRAVKHAATTRANLVERTPVVLAPVQAPEATITPTVIAPVATAPMEIAPIQPMQITPDQPAPTTPAQPPQ